MILRPERHIYELLDIEMEDDYTAETLEEEKNTLEILSIRDDGGYPFVVFT